MLFGTCRGTRRILIASVLLLGADTVCSETLRHVLAAKNLPIAVAKLENLDKNITSGAELDDETQFLIAYYIDDGTSALNPPLYLERFDRKLGSWKGAMLEKAEARWQDMEVPCLGSVMNVTAVGNRFFFDTHINPSAGCMLIVSSDLKLEASLYGWLVGRLGTEVVIYHRSQIHFAPVHPAEIALHDLRTKYDVTLFPPKQESPIRQARTQRVQSFLQGQRRVVQQESRITIPAIRHISIARWKAQQRQMKRSRRWHSSFPMSKSNLFRETYRSPTDRRMSCTFIAGLERKPRWNTARCYLRTPSSSVETSPSRTC
jgi:hypothetical protein